MTARANAARAAVVRVLRGRKAARKLWYQACDEDALADSLLSALAPSLALAEDELGAGHGARRSS